MAETPRAEPRGIDTHRKFRSALPAPELPSTFLVAAEALGLPVDPSLPRYFHFRRKRGGTLVYIKQGPLTYLAHEAAERFNGARRWARAFAAAHGFVYRESRGL